MPVAPKQEEKEKEKERVGGSTLSEIQRLQREREERRRAMGQLRHERAAEQQRNADNGNFGDVDYQVRTNVCMYVCMSF